MQALTVGLTATQATDLASSLQRAAQMIQSRITHTGDPRALIENQGQPHATTAIPTVASDGQEMRSQNAERETVPVSSGEGPQALPNARRRTRIRSSKRSA